MARVRLAMRARLLVLSLVALGCSRSEPGDGSTDPLPGVEPLSLESVAGTAPRPVELVAELEVTEERGWTVAGTGVRWLDPGLGPGLVCSTDTDTELGLPSIEDPGSFNRLVVTVRTPVPQSLFLWIGARGPGGTFAAGRVAAGGPEPTTLVFDLDEVPWPPAPGAEGAAASDLVLFVPGRGGQLELLSASLHRVPLERWLPTPEEGPAMVAVGQESRRCVGLATGRPLRARFEARPGSELIVSRAVPPVSGRAGGAHRILLELSDDSGATVREELDAGGAWASASVDLGRLRGPVEARFELRVGGRAEGAAEEADGGLAALGVPLLAVRARRSGPPPRSVVLVTSDTHRADHVGAFEGGVEVATPNLDRLASGGLFFQDAISPSNVTKPSHVSLMTGTPVRDTRVTENGHRLSPEPVTLAEVFREAGWVTWATVCVTLLNDERSGLGQGFDRVFAPREYVQDSSEALDRLFEWSDEADGLPLFVWVHSYDVHTPYVERERFLRPYYPADRDPRSGALEPLPVWVAPPDHPDIRDLDYLVALYRSEVSYLDEQLGRLFGHPRLGSALTAFTADHGESLTSHGTWFNHGGLYPQTLRIPLIVRGPGVPVGVRADRPVELLDLGRTLLDLSGLEAADFPGRSLLEEPEGEAPRFAMAVYGRSACVFSGRWMFTLHLRPHRLLDPAWPPIERHSTELYDLAADPTCTTNLVEVERERAGRLRSLLVDWLTESGGAGGAGWTEAGESADARALAELEALGYAASTGAARADDWIDPECGCEECAAYR